MTYFQVNIKSNNRNHTSCMMACSTLEKAVATAIREASYYAVECGYAPSFSITELCSTCHGEGTITQRAGKTVRSKLVTRKCMTCKGKSPIKQIIGDVSFQFHSNAGEKLIRVEEINE